MRGGFITEIILGVNKKKTIKDLKLEKFKIIDKNKTWPKGNKYAWAVCFERATYSS